MRLISAPPPAADAQAAKSTDLRPEDPPAPPIHNLPPPNAHPSRGNGPKRRNPLRTDNTSCNVRMDRNIGADWGQMAGTTDGHDRGVTGPATCRTDISRNRATTPSVPPAPQQPYVTWGRTHRTRLCWTAGLRVFVVEGAGHPRGAAWACPPNPGANPRDQPTQHKAAGQQGSGRCPGRALPSRAKRTPHPRATTP